MRVSPHLIRLIAAPALSALMWWLAGPAEAGASRIVDRLDDARVCGQLIGAAEKALGMPDYLMHAVGVVESGRYDRGRKRAEPWPWTINVAGKGRVFATKAEAVAAVEAARRAGTTSIDVGCMQVNLAFHGDAFASLDEAFDPVMNVAYAAHFLTTLHADRGSWNAAVAAYHSSTPERGRPYRQKVARTWHEMRARTIADIVRERKAEIIETNKRQRAALAARQAERLREQAALRSIHTWPEIAPPDSLVTEIVDRRASAEAETTSR
jgi:hypothetical protein